MRLLYGARSGAADASGILVVPMREAVTSAACAFAAAVLLTGCNGGGGTSTAAPTTVTAPSGPVVNGVHVLAVVKVHETEFRIVPRTIGLNRIGYFGIKAVNDGKDPHALAVRGPGVAERTKTIEPHESAALVVFFRKPGVYKLYCPIADHARRGMTATIRVR